MELLEAFHAHRPEGFAPRYEVELLYALTPPLEAAPLRAALPAHGVDALVEVEPGALRLVLAAERPGLRPGWRLEPALPRTDRLAAAFEQSWWWREARVHASGCGGALVLRDDGIAALDGRRRLELLQRVLAAVLAAAPERTPCRAVHWVPSQQVLDPHALLHAWQEDGYDAPLPAALNVRLFRLEPVGGRVEDDAEFVMDTLGLTALGLCDLQCHFRGLDPAEVGRALHQTALYLWQHGAVLGTGDTVAGLRPGDVWRCQPELALAAPRREVIDLDPGFPFTGGVDPT